MVSCRECGTEVDVSDAYCSACGAKQPSGTAEQDVTASDGAGHITSRSPTTVQREQQTSTAHPELDTDVVLRRVGAVVIDSILASIVIAITLIILQGRGGLLLIYLILYPAYFAVAEAWAGHTPGKAVLGLTVIQENGDSISTEQAVIRNVIRPIDGIFNYLVGLVVILVTGSNQRLGDLAANTLVARKQSRNEGTIHGV